LVISRLKVTASAIRGVSKTAPANKKNNKFLVLLAFIYGLNHSEKQVAIHRRVDYKKIMPCCESINASLARLFIFILPRLCFLCSIVRGLLVARRLSFDRR